MNGIENFQMCDYLTPLHFKGLSLWILVLTCICVNVKSCYSCCKEELCDGRSLFRVHSSLETKWLEKSVNYVGISQRPESGHLMTL